MDLRQTPQYKKYLEDLGWTTEGKRGVYYFVKKIPLLGNIIKIQRPKTIDYQFIDKLVQKYKPFQIILEPQNLNYELGTCLPTGKIRNYEDNEEIRQKLKQKFKTKLKINSVCVGSVVHKEILSHGYKLSKSTYLPSKTVVLDLSKNQSQLLKEMHYKTRYNIRKTHNSIRSASSGLMLSKLVMRTVEPVKASKFIIHNSNRIELFADFWQECAKKQRGAYISQKKEIIALFNAFKKNCSIVFIFSPLTTHNSLPTAYCPQSTVHPSISSSPSLTAHYSSPTPYRPPTTTHLLAGVFSIYTKDTAYYMYAASSTEGKKLFAPTLAAWESIKLAKKRGCKFYDFEGVYDQRFPIASWKGFSRFKLSFGENVVEYPGCYTKFIWRNLFRF